MYRVAIDCRELTREKLRSIGIILERMMADSPYEDLVLFSDVPLKRKYLCRQFENVVYGKVNGGGMDVVKYQYWMKKQCETLRISAFYQVNHYSLFKMKGTRIVTTIHDLFPLEGIDSYSKAYQLLFRIFIRRTLRNSDVVTTVSRFTYDNIQKKFGKYDNVVVVPNGIDRPATPAADEKPYIDGKYLLMLGRVCKWKGVSRLLDIYISELSDSGLKLVIAGEATEQTVKEHVLKCCRENPNIIWLDYVSDALKSNLYKNAAVLCYPSVYDGFGLPPLEAACYGTKCLMNDIPVLREVTKGKGYYVDYYGDGKAADAILRVIDDDNTVTEAVKRVAMSYSWHDWAEKIYSLLRK